MRQPARCRVDLDPASASEHWRHEPAADAAFDWDPADPRVEELADAMVRYIERRYEQEVTLKWDVDDPTVVALLTAHFGDASSPALERLNELTESNRASHQPEP
jgi:hypothetical protein